MTTAPVVGIPNLLFESSGVYVPQSQPVVTDSTAEVLYRAATSGRDLETIRDDPRGPVGADLRRPIGIDGPLANLLAGDITVDDLQIRPGDDPLPDLLADSRLWAV